MATYKGNEINTTPTDAMVAEAKRGLEWREEYGRGGTSVGVARARDIANRRELSIDTVKRMSSFFARHEVDKQAEGFGSGEDGYPSAGRIAWALWGGDPGQAFARRVMRSVNAADDGDRASNGRADLAGALCDPVQFVAVRKVRNNDDRPFAIEGSNFQLLRTFGLLLDPRVLMPFVCFICQLVADLTIRGRNFYELVRKALIDSRGRVDLLF